MAGDDVGPPLAETVLNLPRRNSTLVTLILSVSLKYFAVVAATRCGYVSTAVVPNLGGYA